MLQKKTAKSSRKRPKCTPLLSNKTSFHLRAVPTSKSEPQLAGVVFVRKSIIDSPVNIERSGSLLETQKKRERRVTRRSNLFTIARSLVACKFIVYKGVRPLIAAFSSIISSHGERRGSEEVADKRPVNLL